MTTSSVQEARATLAQAEASQAKELRTQNIARLKSTRVDLRSAQRDLEKLKSKIFTGQSDLDNTRADLLRWSDELSRLQALKPAVADHLPDDPESAAWTGLCLEAENEIKKLQARRAALPNVELLRIEGVKLAQRVQELLYAESNTLHVLDGTLATKPSGGVFGV